MHAATEVESRTEPGADGRARPPAFGYVPALDGLRAVAVLGVLLYHGGAPLSGGGFLGVNIFFVLSGFLITSLLIGEWGRRATVRLGQFWARRARRLLPALLLLLAGVAAYARFAVPAGSVPSLRLDALSTLTYVANWHFIVGGADYFAATARPSPLEHMWSLAIEEQFYLVWPPVVLGLLHLGRRLRPSRRLVPVLVAAAAGAVASAAAMRIAYLHGASFTRLYEGTDTRCQDILVGAVLAVALAMWAERRRPAPLPVPELVVDRVHPAAGTTGLVPAPPHRRDIHRRRGAGIRPVRAWELRSRWARAAGQVAGWAALGAVLVLWARLDGPTGFLFGGGELLVAVIVSVLLFAVVTAQTGSVARALAVPVLRYVGVISYGVYLWHFPLFLLLDSSRLHLVGPSLLAVRLAATFAVATASYYLVELPIRQGRLLSLAEWRAWLTTAGAMAAVVGVTVAATLPAAAEAAGPARIVGQAAVGPTVKVAVLGDSVAWRLGFSLQAAQPEQAYGVSIDDAAIVGCGVLRTTRYRAQGTADPMVAACDPAAPTAVRWPALWRSDLEQFRPDVAMVLAGRWEVMDRWVGGKWGHIGQPAVDAEVRASLEEAVRVASSTGAYVELLTAPCFSSGEQPDGQPWPEDAPARLARYNQLVRQVAAVHPETVRVVDFGALACPSGRFTTTVGGVLLRDGDGVHIVPTAAAGAWLAARLLPPATVMGRAKIAGRPLGAPGPGPTSPPVTASAAGVTGHLGG